MAGDWLKIETATPDKPEVFAIAARMGWDDPDLAVGKLFRVWRWFDQHTSCGNARSVTLALLDRISGVTGFAEAMQSVGWLLVDSSGVSLPNFDRHCGKTAKDRALTAKRVASHKSNAKGNADTVTESVTSALPREEKRREEKISKPTKIKSSRSANAADAIRFDEFWAVYPKKAAKPAALKSWRAKKLDQHADQIIENVRARIDRDRQWSEPQFIPNPTTYLNQDRWNDPIQEARPVQQQSRPASKQMQGLEAIFNAGKNYGMDGTGSSKGLGPTVHALPRIHARIGNDRGDDSGMDRRDPIEGDLV
jgi:hypothetical protein